MRMLSEFVHRYLSPFIAGASMAATTVVHEVPLVVLMLAVAAFFGFMSLPAGGRVIRRATGAGREA